MEPAKYVHGGEGTLVEEDDVVVAVAAIVDDAERKGVLTWYARVACGGVVGGRVADGEGGQRPSEDLGAARAQLVEVARRAAQVRATVRARVRVSCTGSGARG